ncbi:MAG TPA: FHA domain-containing protein [Thermoanaerobaculia bacterium]|nr:FHA domain-containing protein [Thermoanaerobaculia bacterium]
MPTVLTVNDAGTEKRIVVEARAVVGRDPDCDVVLSSRSVSRKHAIVERRGEGWVARDLGSANGLFVEGKRVSEAPLASGASIRFGDVEATFTAGAQRTTSAERLAQSLSVAPSRRARPVALVVVVTLSIAALAAATVWSRYCDGASRASAPAAAPAHG